MSKEFDEYIADESGLNLLSKEEISLLKIKLGKSHRKESDWEIIKEIFWKRDVLTFTPNKKVRGIANIENVLCEDGTLVVFSNIDDCEYHIRLLQQGGKIGRYAQIGSIPFLNVLDIADEYKMDVLIDETWERDSKCFMYAHENKELKAVIMAQPW